MKEGSDDGAELLSPSLSRFLRCSRVNGGLVRVFGICGEGGKGQGREGQGRGFGGCGTSTPSRQRLVVACFFPFFPSPLIQPTAWCISDYLE